MTHLPSSQPPSSNPRPLSRTDVLNAAGVAEMLGVPPSTVADWARRGVIASRSEGGDALSPLGD
jgi:hypothetical protein